MTVELILERNGQLVSHQNFTNTSEVVDSGLHLWAEMYRNDTHLEFYVRVGDTVTPSVLYTISPGLNSHTTRLHTTHFLLISSITVSSLLPLLQV